MGEDRFRREEAGVDFAWELREERSLTCSPSDLWWDACSWSPKACGTWRRRIVLPAAILLVRRAHQPGEVGRLGHPLPDTVRSGLAWITCADTGDDFPARSTPRDDRPG